MRARLNSWILALLLAGIARLFSTPRSLLRRYLTTGCLWCWLSSTPFRPWITNMKR
jgi:hypothetical protein